MISIIISSKDPVLAAKVKANISSTVGIPHEVIIIENGSGQMGICEAYNKGAQQSMYDILCFMHEDILFHTSDWGAKVVNHLSDPSIGLIGIVGSTIKSQVPSEVWVRGFDVNRLYQLQYIPNEENYLKHENPLQERVSDVTVIDGLWMCCRKDVWRENKFDEKLLQHFHGYDLDFSLQIFQHYRVCVVYDILLEHFSTGVFNAKWVDGVIKVTEKWAHALPAVSAKIDRQKLKKIEESNLRIFCNTLIAIKYNRLVTVSFLIKLMLSNPLEKANLKVLLLFLTGKNATEKLRAMKLRLSGYKQVA